MFGFSPISATPFTSLSGGVSFDSAVEESVSISDAASSLPIYALLISETATGTDESSVSASTFSAIFEDVSTLSDSIDGAAEFFVSFSDSSQASDTSSATAALQVYVSEIANALDSTSVAPSIFNSVVAEQVNAVAQFLANVSFIATIQEGSTVADQLLARFLWEVINDLQAADWNSINDSQTANWGLIDDGPDTTWNTIPTQP